MSKRATKFEFTEKQKHARVINGPTKSLVLPQIVKSGAQSAIVRNESPWDTFQKVFSCVLAGRVTIAVHCSHLSRVVTIREYPTEDADKMLERFHKIQHGNIISAKECYKHQGKMYALVEDLPLTLQHLVGCRTVYLSECQLASIVTQVSHPRSSDSTEILLTFGGPQWSILPNHCWLRAQILDML